MIPLMKYELSRYTEKYYQWRQAGHPLKDFRVEDEDKPMSMEGSEPDFKCLASKRPRHEESASFDDINRTKDEPTVQINEVREEPEITY